MSAASGLMPAPPAFKPFVIQYQHEEDIVEIVETIRPLRINGIIPNAVVIAHALYEAPVKARRSDYVSGPGSISDEAVRKITKDHKLGIWNVYAALYGNNLLPAADDAETMGLIPFLHEGTIGIFAGGLLFAALAVIVSRMGMRTLK